MLCLDSKPCLESGESESRVMAFKESQHRIFYCRKEGPSTQSFCPAGDPFPRYLSHFNWTKYQGEIDPLGRILTASVRIADVLVRGFFHKRIIRFKKISHSNKESLLKTNCVTNSSSSVGAADLLAQGFSPQLKAPTPTPSPAPAFSPAPAPLDSCSEFRLFAKAAAVSTYASISRLTSSVVCEMDDARDPPFTRALTSTARAGCARAAAMPPPIRCTDWRTRRRKQTVDGRGRQARGQQARGRQARGTGGNRGAI